MFQTGPAGAVHDETFSQALAALASPTRLQLLRALRAPRALAEIQVRAPEGDRNIARQTVREHLNKLIQVGMVTTREVDRAYGDTVEFVANHQTLFALAEEVRGLSRVRPAIELDAPTVHADHRVARPPDVGARFVMVKGLDEGAAFDLRPPANGPAREWIIGRRRGVAVSLDFDPYVSSENSRVTFDGVAHVVENIPGSRNGTAVNFHQLAEAERRPLRHGDVVGVGRSLLVFWDR